jgi:hypothetical protein
VRTLLADWQSRDREAKDLPKRLNAGNTREHTLFSTWREQDAAMSERDRAAEDDLWKELEPALANADFAVRNESAA